MPSVLAFSSLLSPPTSELTHSLSEHLRWAGHVSSVYCVNDQKSQNVRLGPGPPGGAHCPEEGKDRNANSCNSIRRSPKQDVCRRCCRWHRKERKRCPRKSTWKSQGWGRAAHAVQTQHSRSRPAPAFICQPAVTGQLRVDWGSSLPVSLLPCLSIPQFPVFSATSDL